MTKPTKKRRKVPPNEKGLEPRGNTYYHRYYIKSIPSWIKLCTRDKIVARQRNIEVLKVLDDIKAGKEYYLYWLDDIQKNESNSTIEAVGEKFIQAKRNELESSTIITYSRSINYLIESIGNIEMEKINISHFDKYITYFKTRNENITADTINKNLRHIRSFINWCKDREYVNPRVKVQKIKTNFKPPKYISNSEYEALCKYLTPFMRRIALFYRSTGLRKNEAFLGKVNGNFYEISAENYKTNRPFSIPISRELSEINVEMQARYKNGDYISRVIKKAQKEAGIFDKCLHSFRHTFALRTYLATRDIFLVQKLMGHTTIIETSKYARFEFNRLFEDFPDLVIDETNLTNPITNITNYQVSPYYA
jgi:integrase